MSGGYVVVRELMGGTLKQGEGKSLGEWTEPVEMVILSVPRHKKPGPRVGLALPLIRYDYAPAERAMSPSCGRKEMERWRRMVAEGCWMDPEMRI